MERCFTLHSSSGAVDIQPQPGKRFPILNLPLHIGEDRRIGNLLFLVTDSSYPRQLAEVEFFQISSGSFNLEDLNQDGGVLLIGPSGKLACRGVNHTGFVVLALCLDRTIKVNSPERF